jgi:hypothetical protein
MANPITSMVPAQTQDLIDFLAAPVSWIPGVQKMLIGMVLDHSSVGTAVVGYLLLLFPTMLAIGGIWCTMLSVYTVPFRSGRVDLLKMLLLAWWDSALATWTYWVGLGRFVIVVMGWLITLTQLALRLVVDTLRQIIMFPFTMTGMMTQSYFQPGVPWIAFFLLLGWCLLEATVFTYTLMPTITEVLAGITGGDASPYTLPGLFLFLFFLITGSFACIQALADAVKNREFKFMVQMVMIEVFVMVFEVMFLYRELVDAITPWIAQQTSETFRPGIFFTLSLATFAWVGIRGMTWFLFGQYGTPIVLAFISRQPMETGGARGLSEVPSVVVRWWRAPLDDFKTEIEWLHEKATELVEYLTLPVLHVVGAALNFAMILLMAKPVFNLPFKSLKEALELRALLSSRRLEVKKVA